MKTEDTPQVKALLELMGGDMGATIMSDAAVRESLRGQHRSPQVQAVLELLRQSIQNNMDALTAKEQPDRDFCAGATAALRQQLFELASIITTSDET